MDPVLMRPLLISLLFSGLLGAVPIRSQQILSDGFIIDTTQTGKLEVHVVTNGGGSFTVNVLKDGLQVNTSTFVNPTTAQIESYVATQIGGLLNIKNGILTVATMQFFWHVNTVNPLSLNILCADVGVTVSATWWQ